MAKEKAEKEPKPKKSFEMKVIVWDDGETDVELHEYRDNPSGRGAPGKWRMTQTDFVRRIEETMANPASNLLEDVYDKLGRKVSETAEAKDLVGKSVTPVQSTDYVVHPPVEKPSKKKKDEKVDETPLPEEPDPKDMDFGGFDTEPNK